MKINSTSLPFVVKNDHQLTKLAGDLLYDPLISTFSSIMKIIS